jgi:chemotaxis protein MotB
MYGRHLQKLKKPAVAMVPRRALKRLPRPDPMTDKNKRPIIVIKKKVAHAGHHGGAWKVAYADFVTAMMALFIVLWLTSSGEKVRKSIAGYFNDPSGKTSTPGSDRAGGDSIPLNKENISDLKERLQSQIAKRPDLKALADDIEIAITPEGMRIELIEKKDGTFFESGSAVVNATGKELLTLLAKELGGVPNRISTEGHTDAQPYSDQTKYDNWELSTDRANSARRVMQSTGLHLGQVSQVRGFADQQLRVPGNPLDPSNRRISVIVHYLEIVPPAELDVKSGGGEQAGADKAVAGAKAETPTGSTKPRADAKSPTHSADQQEGKGTPGITPKAGATVAAIGSQPVAPGASTAKPTVIHALLNRLPAVKMPELPSATQRSAMFSRVTSVFSRKRTAPAATPPPTTAPPVSKP